MQNKPNVYTPESTHINYWQNNKATAVNFTGAFSSTRQDKCLLRYVSPFSSNMIGLNYCKLQESQLSQRSRGAPNHVKLLLIVTVDNNSLWKSCLRLRQWQSSVVNEVKRETINNLLLSRRKQLDYDNVLTIADMPSKVIQDQRQWYCSVDHYVASMLCNKRVSLWHRFLDALNSLAYVTARDLGQLFRLRQWKLYTTRRWTLNGLK